MQSCLRYWDVNNLYDWELSQKLPVNNFEWIEGTSYFNEDFTKTILKKLIKDIFWGWWSRSWKITWTS